MNRYKAIGKVLEKSTSRLGKASKDYMFAFNILSWMKR